MGRRFRYSSGLRWLLVPVVLLGVGLPVALARYPSSGIDVHYSPRLDRFCSLLRGPAIDQVAQRELSSIADEYLRLWNDVGPPMLSTAESLTGLAPPDGRTVRLTLCDIPSQSLLGITVNMRFALRSYTPSPVPLRYKVDVLFHELLHRMLAGHLPQESDLPGSDARASRCVRDHVHLLALQKAVLLARGETAAYEDVVRIDGSLPEPCYRSAWQIVNATPMRYLDFVAEIARQDQVSRATAPTADAADRR